ncbi:MAG: TrmB family transcriptional regulator [archaeon]
MTDLGLSHNQARIYLANLHCGPTPAKSLAKVTKIAREDVYRLLSFLEGKKIIKRQICYPTLFEAIPLKKAITTLLQKKQQDLCSLKNETNSFIEKLDDVSRENLKPTEEGRILYYKSLRFDQLLDAYNQARTRVDFTTRSDVLYSVLANPNYAEAQQEAYEALNRGVKFRGIVDNSKKQNLSFFAESSLCEKIRMHKNYQFRYVTRAPESIIALFDNKKAFIWTVSEDWIIAPLIEVICPSIINLVHTYFSVLWETSELP